MDLIYLRYCWSKKFYLFIFYLNHHKMSQGRFAERFVNIGLDLADINKETVCLFICFLLVVLPVFLFFYSLTSIGQRIAETTCTQKLNSDSRIVWNSSISPLAFCDFLISGLIGFSLCSLTLYRFGVVEMHEIDPKTCF